MVDLFGDGIGHAVIVYIVLTSYACTYEYRYRRQKSHIGKSLIPIRAYKGSIRLQEK